MKFRLNKLHPLYLEVRLVTATAAFTIQLIRTNQHNQGWEDFFIELSIPSWSIQYVKSTDFLYNYTWDVQSPDIDIHCMKWDGGRWDEDRAGELLNKTYLFLSLSLSLSLSQHTRHDNAWFHLL